jgi:hypothetical protein
MAKLISRFAGRRAFIVVTVLAVAGLVTAACGPSGPLRVTTIQTGRSLNSDKSVGNHTTRFKPDDTMFVSVLTDGPGSGTIGVRWRFVGRLVSEESKDVSYRDHAATEFHIQNSSGFPPGDYSVEVLVDGKPFATRTLRVEK